jgi:hypothetical protein
MKTATKITPAGPETATAFGWTIQRGYLYRVIVGPDATTAFEQADGSTVGLGYHGNDVPPCGADYLYGNEDETLVISSKYDPAAIDCVNGVTLEPVVLEPGGYMSDGTWEFRVLEVKSDNETVIAGKC